MAYIRTIAENEATGELARLYRQVGSPDGTVDNVMKVHSLNPVSLRTHFQMYQAAMHEPSPLSLAEREMVAVVVSRLNGCQYCLRHHQAGLIRLLTRERRDLADALAEDNPGEFTDRENVMISYAKKLTTAPMEMTEQDIVTMRGAGLDDRAILDLTQCVGYFCYVNRIVTGLGVKLGVGEGPPDQWPT